LYGTGYLDKWLHSKLDPLDIRTFGDLKITDDPSPAFLSSSATDWSCTPQT
jgi:hypothetical protein